jgi:hypothetical protein
MGDNPMGSQPNGSQDSLALPTRTGRALIGWMSPDRGEAMLAGPLKRGDEHDHRVRAQAARDAVAARDPGVDQDGLLEEPPDELGEFLEQLAAEKHAAALFNEGWVVKIADLARVCSLQQQVTSGDATDRIGSGDVGDLVSVARVTLPTPSVQSLPIAFDDVHQTWTVSAANPNLKILGHFHAEVEGLPGVGFVVGVAPSFMQVALHHGRYVLRDGYHRAYGLLARGITQAPVVFRDFDVGDLGVHQGLFPTDIYLGQRPPYLADFCNDEVAAEVDLPVGQKVLVIQGLELTPIG